MTIPTHSKLVALLCGALALPACVASGGEDDIEDIEIVEPGQDTQGGKPICSILCIAPPDGCTYRGALLTGPCNRVTCGHLVCK